MVHFRGSHNPSSSFSFASPTRGSACLSFWGGGVGGSWGSVVTPLQPETQTQAGQSRAGQTGSPPQAGQAAILPRRSCQGRASGTIAWRGAGGTGSAGSTRAADTPCPCGTSGQGRQSQPLIPRLQHPQFRVLSPILHPLIPVLPSAAPPFRAATPPYFIPSSQSCCLPTPSPCWGGQGGAVTLAQRNDPRPSHHARIQGHGLINCLPGISSCLQSLVSSSAWNRSNTGWWRALQG